MKKPVKAFLIFSLCAGLLGSAVFPLANAAPAAAAETQSFSDVASDYWGLASIRFAAEKNIINGYRQTNGTFRFKPENSVSCEEAMQMLYKTVKNAGLGPESEGSLSDSYQDILTSAGIPSWAWDCVSYGLKYDILTEADVSGFRDASGNPAAATREETARWAAKAIGGTLMPAVSLSFSDSDKIAAENLFYVDFLTRLGIMIGDSTGKFNPTAKIKRVEYAVICTRLYALANAAYDPAQEIRSYQGKITGIDTAAGSFRLLGSDGTARVIHVDSSAEILLDGKKAALGELPSGVDVIAAWGPFGQVDVAAGALRAEGDIAEIRQKGDGCREFVIKNTAGISVSYFVIDAEAEISGDPAVGDNVRYIADGVKLIELAVE